jgi:Winged helix-turn-helix DNA-binding
VVVEAASLVHAVPEPASGAILGKHRDSLDRAFALLCSSGLIGKRGFSMDEKMLWGFIRVCPSDVTQQELCDLFGLARSTLNRMLRRLEAIGAVSEQRVGLGRPNRRQARGAEQLAGDAVERLAGAANACALARARRAQKRAAADGEQPRLFGNAVTARLSLTEVIAALRRDVGVDFTAGQVRRLKAGLGPDVLLDVACDWYEHRDVARARFGDTAARAVARYIRDGARVPQDMRNDLPSAAVAAPADAFASLDATQQRALLEAVATGRASHQWCAQAGVPKAALPIARALYHKDPHILDRSPQ